MSLILYDTENDLEVMIDSYNEIIPITDRQVLKYVAHKENKPRLLSGSPVSREYRINASVTSNLNDTIKTMNFLTQKGGKILFIVSGVEIASLGYLCGTPMSVISSRANVLPVEIDFVCNTDIIGTAKEAEDCTTTGTVASDSDASSGKCVELNSYMNSVSFTIDQDSILLPESDYKMYVRAKDTNQVSNDMMMVVYNDTDNSTIASDSYTCTSSYDWYSLDFTIDSDDVSDEIIFYPLKATSTSNTILVDLICFVEDV